MNHIDIKEIIEISRQAGQRIMQVYAQPDFAISKKTDNSVLTIADMHSHDYICQSLNTLYPSVPILSEESADQYAYDERQQWQRFFLVDPLDGTKEFIQRNGEFTVNIALIENGQPILGVVYAPALDLLYYAEQHKGAYKVVKDQAVRLSAKNLTDKKVRAVVSRSHLCSQTQAFLDELTEAGHEVSTVTIGSALKFGLIAESVADIYPRFSPTMEWDTAAGHILVSESGKSIHRVVDNQPLQYNKPSLINPGFIVRDAIAN